MSEMNSFGGTVVVFCPACGAAVDDVDMASHPCHPEDWDPTPTRKWDPRITSAASLLGRRGGLKGGKATGASKRRGDSAYYRAMQARRHECRQCHGTIRADAAGSPYWQPRPGTMSTPCADCSSRLRAR